MKRKRSNGERIDHYGGSAASRFFSPVGTPAIARALPPGTINEPLRVFEVVKPFEVEAGMVAPAFGQLGLGTQYRMPVSLGVLLKRGILREVIPWAVTTGPHLHSSKNEKWRCGPLSPARPPIPRWLIMSFFRHKECAYTIA